MMNVDAYMVEDSAGETHIVESGDVSKFYVAGYLPGIGVAAGCEWEGEECQVLAALNLYRSIDHGLRTADGTALELIGEVCEGIVAPALCWMSMAWGSWDFANTAVEHPSTDYLAALNSERGTEWNGNGWMFDLAPARDIPEPIYGQGCEQDMCEDTWTDCGGVVWSDGECGMTWLYVTVEDYTR